MKNVAWAAHCEIETRQTGLLSDTWNNSKKKTSSPVHKVRLSCAFFPISHPLCAASSYYKSLTSAANVCAANKECLEISSFVPKENQDGAHKIFFFLKYSSRALVQLPVLILGTRLSSPALPLEKRNNLVRGQSPSAEGLSFCKTSGLEFS